VRVSQRAFVEVDVFTDRPYWGNPLAVVVDAEGLSTEEMQRFANWTNLSETTFLLAPSNPDADYRVRIFTPTSELSFAGHPTLGSCHAWLTHGGTPRHPNRVVQECEIGLVTLQRTQDGRFAFAAPSLLRNGPVDDAILDEVAATLHLERRSFVDAAWIDNGPGWLGILLRSAEEVLAITPSTTELKIGVIGPYEAGSAFAYEVRAFFGAGNATFEDPVTGSLNASAAQWLIGSGRFTAPYVTSQGTALGRAGKIYVSADESGQIWIGGDVTTCVAGFVEL
jgi:PhzF family phenazine biosynthesis protein